MAKATCPEGHSTTQTDYCDVCGAPIEASSVQSQADPGKSGATGGAAGEDETEHAPVGLRCPNCQVMNAPDALFCEACGYDYTTGTLPRAAQPSVLELDMEVARADADQESNAGQAGPAEGEPASDHRARPRSGSSSVAGATGVATAAGAASGAANSLDLDSPSPQPQASPQESQPSADDVDDPAEQSGAAAPDRGAEGGDAAAQSAPDQEPISPPSSSANPASAGAAGTATGEAGATTDRVIASAEPVEFDHVAELWIDPDWYRLQDSPDQLPSPGLPEVYPLKSDRVLIGRPSRSRGITPDIDCEPDSGTSRRQAELTTDGRRWFVEDLDSANGTFVGQAAGNLPETPIPVGKKHQLDADDRIYVGAWTRLVLRLATPEEKEAFAL